MQVVLLLKMPAAAVTASRAPLTSRWGLPAGDREVVTWPTSDANRLDRLDIVPHAGDPGEEALVKIEGRGLTMGGQVVEGVMHLGRHVDRQH